MRAANDTTTLHPQTSARAPALALDFPSLHIGIAEYPEGPTGCTVFYFPERAQTAVDVRGGSVGMIGEYGMNDAICLAGGSLYGLESVVGVASELFARRGYSTAWNEIALVSGAIIFDYGTRDNAIYPDKALGRAALRAATPGAFPLGRRGAGCSATVGKVPGPGSREPAGQGAAFRRIGEARIAVFTVVNAVGVLLDRGGRVVRGALEAATGRRYAPLEALERSLPQPRRDTAPGNTTLTVLVTNLRLDHRALAQVGKQVHSSMARAIQPFHALTDGDVLFSATTNEVEHPALDALALGLLASELAWDAVLSSFQDEPPVEQR